jgi:outer membrane protein insertion porin family
VAVKEGTTFSRALVEFTSNSITTVLGNIGYAFAEVSPIPDVDRANHKVALNFVVKPGARVVVRRIAFKGNSSTADEVLRREMRQFEGAFYSQAMIDRSKIRLRRTGYFETVEVETAEVAGHKDQVDVVFTVKERNAGSFVFGLGYSQNAGIVTSISLTQNNFLGTGNRFSIGLQNNSYSKSINFQYIDPYFTDDGVTVGYSLSYSDYSQTTNSTARYSAGNAAAEVTFGIPLSENTSLSTAFGISRNAISTYDNTTPPSIIHYLVQTLGDRARDTYYVSNTVNDDNNPLTPAANDDGDPTHPDPLELRTGGTRQWIVNAWTARFGWSYDTRNDYVLPSSGVMHRLSGEIALPGSDLEYYRLSYDFEHYWRLAPWLIMKSAVSLGYGDSYGRTHDKECFLLLPNGNPSGTPIPGTGEHCGLPFFKNFYAGGPGSVRGFTANTLGPTYSFTGNARPQPLGGAVKTTGSFEFFFPKLLGGIGPGSRISAFVDYGYVYARPSDFQFNQFRISTGVALQWQSPVGPITISYAFPIDKGRLDDVEALQFTFGNQQ